MSIDSIFEIAASGMSAQSIRLNTVSSNIANANSVSSNTDETYRAKKPIFQTLINNHIEGAMSPAPDGLGAQLGVKVAEIIESEAPFDMRYEPHHPMADEQGYVAYPNVNVMNEMADLISASRSFQNNVDVLETAKTLMSRVITLGQN
jgi:flagellar basal-body rod protein FlgC